MIFFLTGGSRGIGAGVVKELVAAGHSVAFTYATRADLAETVAAEAVARNDGTQCRAYALDLRDPKAVERVADQVLDTFGSVDVVVKPRLALETLKKLFAERRLAAFEAAFETEARMHRIVLGDAATRKRIEAEFVE